MNEHHDSGYARAALAVAEAEGATEAVERELRAIAHAIEENDELRRALTDTQLPLGRRLAAFEGELLAAVHPATRTVLAMVLAAERAGELAAIVGDMSELVASGRVTAEVASAVPLDEQRRVALTAALERATGHELDVRFVVDDSVVGGVRATVGDTVIDGSLLKRMSELRARIGL